MSCTGRAYLNWKPLNQAAVCTQYVDTAIGLEAAPRIFSAVFSAIGFCCSISAAFKQAKAALMLEGISEVFLNK